MNEIMKLLEAFVSQGEAQFSCGDRYATFNRQMIEQARQAIEAEKKKSKPMTVDEAFKMYSAINTSPSLNNNSKMIGCAYITGYAGAMLGENEIETKASIVKMIGGEF